MRTLLRIIDTVWWSFPTMALWIYIWAVWVGTVEGWDLGLDQLLRYLP